MFTLLLWCLLFVFCWPLAVLALVFYGLVQLGLLPFRIVGFAFGRRRCPCCGHRHRCCC